MVEKIKIFKNTKTILLGILFVCGILFSASEVKADGPIDNCGVTLAAPGTYTLSHSISTTSPTCITITATGVVITDGGNGYSVGKIVADATGGPAGYSFTVAGTTRLTGVSSIGDGGLGIVTFNDTSSNSGTLTGNAIFAGDGSYNSGIVTGDAQFTGAGSYNNSIVTGNATFSYLTSINGSVTDTTGYANGRVNGTTKDSGGATIDTWIFSTTNNLGTVTGSAIFSGAGTYNAPAFAYVVNHDSGTLQKFNTATMTLSGSIATDGNTSSGAISPDGKYVYVVNYLNTLQKFNTATMALAGSVHPFGNNPISVAVSPDGVYVYVTAYNSSSGYVLQKFNTSDMTLLGSSFLGRNPTSVAISPDGVYAYVISHDSAVLQKINIATMTQVGSNINTVDPFSVAVSPDGLYVYVGSQRQILKKFSAVTMTQIGSVATGYTTRSIVVSPDGVYVYALNADSNTLQKFNTATMTQVGNDAPTQNNPYSVSISSDGAYVYLVDNGSNTLQKFNTATMTQVRSSVTTGNGSVSVSVSRGGVVTANATFSGSNTKNEGSVLGTGTFFDSASNLGYAQNVVNISTASGLTYNNHTGDGQWNTPENWVGGVVPASGQNAIIEASVALSNDITNNIFVISNNVTIDGGGHTITGNINANGLTVNVNNANVLGNIDANGGVGETNVETTSAPSPTGFSFDGMSSGGSINTSIEYKIYPYKISSDNVKVFSTSTQDITAQFVSTTVSVGNPATGIGTPDTINVGSYNNQVINYYIYAYKSDGSGNFIVSANPLQITVDGTADGDGNPQNWSSNLSWDSVPGADGYLVLNNDQIGTDVLADVGSATNFIDDGTWGVPQPWGYIGDGSVSNDPANEVIQNANTGFQTYFFYSPYITSNVGYNLSWNNVGADGYVIDDVTDGYYKDVGVPTAFLDNGLSNNGGTTGIAPFNGVFSPHYFSLSGNTADAGPGGSINVASSTISGTLSVNGGNATYGTASAAGSVNVTNSTVSSSISAVGGIGVTGGAGGTVSVDPSSTGDIVVNGGNGTLNGGHGGTVTIDDSLGVSTTTAIIANGGNSTSCGNGGDSGVVNITNSDNYTVTSNIGQASDSGCILGGTHTNGASHPPVITGNYTPPAIHTPTPTPTPTPNSSKGGSSTYNPLAQQLSLPVSKISTLKLAALPTFGTEAKGSFSLLSPITNFLFAPIPNISPALKTLLTSKGITSVQDLATLKNKPIVLDKIPSGLFTITTSNISIQNPFAKTANAPKSSTIKSSLSSDSTHGLIELITVLPNTSLVVSLKGETAGTFNGKPISFTNGSASITTPRKAGRYYFTSPGASAPLAIDVLQTTLNTAETTTSNFFSPVTNFFKNIFHF